MQLKLLFSIVNEKIDHLKTQLKTLENTNKEFENVLKQREEEETRLKSEHEFKQKWLKVTCNKSLETAINSNQMEEKSVSYA